jgi:ketosteroid isomerase-like protein
MDCVHRQPPGSAPDDAPGATPRLLGESARRRNPSRPGGPKFIDRMKPASWRLRRSSATNQPEGLPMSTATNANIAHVQSLYAAFGRGDIAALLAGCASDIDWQTVGRPEDFPTIGPRKGTKAVEEFFRLVAEHEEFSDFSPREFYAAEDKVFVLGSYTLTVKASRTPVSAEWVHVFTVKDGKVTRFREHTDTAQFAGTAVKKK